MVLQLKVLESEEDRGAFCDYNQPGALDVVGVQSREVGARYVARGS